MPDYCEACVYYCPAAHRHYGVCVHPFGANTDAAMDPLDTCESWRELPFTDGPEVDDEQARRELRGEAT
jgi:hypothetical protein